MTMSLFLSVSGSRPECASCANAGLPQPVVETCDNPCKESWVLRSFSAGNSRRGAKRAALWLAVLSLAAPLLLTGCGNFFTCEGKADCPSNGGGGGTTTGGDYAYVSNSASGSAYVAEYDLSSGKLTAISGSPYNLTFVPVALSVAPSDSFLYAATPPGVTNPGIYLYKIGSDGALTAGNSGTILANDEVSSMDISPDGGYLFTVNADGLTMNEYTVNTTTGLLQLATTVSLPGVTCALEAGTDTPLSQSCTVKVAPSGSFVIVALGTAGDAVFSYSSSSGLTSASPISVISSGTTTGSPTGDFSLVLDANNYAYIARTNALAVYAISSTGSATQQDTKSYSSGTVPRSVVLSSNGDYVYTANEGASTISEYGIGAGGVLTQLTGSPVAAPTNVSALGADNSGNYLVAAGYGASAGVRLFSIGSSGALTQIDSAASGAATSSPAVLALTH
jgi:6-phosphogluconolactonase (cycloisomerase 2 family)